MSTHEAENNLFQSSPQAENMTELERVTTVLLELHTPDTFDRVCSLLEAFQSGPPIASRKESLLRDVGEILSNEESLALFRENLGDLDPQALRMKWDARIHDAVTASNSIPSNEKDESLNTVLAVESDFVSPEIQQSSADREETSVASISESDVSSSVEEPVDPRTLSALGSNIDNLYSILVSKLPAEAGERDLRNAFKRFGTVWTARVMRDAESRHSKLFGYVGFLDPDSRDKAIATKPIVIFDQEVEISEALQGEKITLFVAGIPRHVTDEKLAEAIRDYGGDFMRIEHKRSGPPDFASRGFCFVEYDTTACAADAMDLLAKSRIWGFPLRVQWAEANRTSVDDSDSKTLWVGNVAANAEPSDLERIFSKYGKLESVSIPRDSSGHLKGFAFVNYEKHADAKEAIESMRKIPKDFVCLGMTLTADWAKPNLSKYERHKSHDRSRDRDRDRDRDRPRDRDRDRYGDYDYDGDRHYSRDRVRSRDYDRDYDRDRDRDRDRDHMYRDRDRDRDHYDRDRGYHSSHRDEYPALPYGRPDIRPEYPPPFGHPLAYPVQPPVMDAPMDPYRSSYPPQQHPMQNPIGFPPYPGMGVQPNPQVGLPHPAMNAAAPSMNPNPSIDPSALASALAAMASSMNANRGGVPQSMQPAFNQGLAQGSSGPHAHALLQSVLSGKSPGTELSSSSSSSGFSSLQMSKGSSMGPTSSSAAGPSSSSSSIPPALLQVLSMALRSDKQQTTTPAPQSSSQMAFGVPARQNPSGQDSYDPSSAGPGDFSDPRRRRR